jgi:hypothetical protein
LKIYVPSAREAVISHLTKNSHKDLSPTEIEIIGKFAAVHDHFLTCKGKAKLNLLKELDDMLRPLGLTADQRRASIALQDAFDIF